MGKLHTYSLQLLWTGNKGKGTISYDSYDRSHIVSVAGKPDLECSSDAAFRGDNAKYNPEDLLIASLSACHMLWYLHICSQAGVVVINYLDKPSGTMTETSNGGGHFTEVTLSPTVTVAEQAMVEKAIELHKMANQLCFIANSVNFPIYHKPNCLFKA